MPKPHQPVDQLSGELPRVDLREPAFRRYEQHIFKAFTSPVYETDPLPGQKATTFIVRFRDAVLGFINYRYASYIPHDPVRLKLLVLNELSNGKIRIKNLHFNQAQSQTVSNSTSSKPLFTLPSGLSFNPNPAADSYIDATDPTTHPLLSAIAEAIESGLYDPAIHTPTGGFIVHCGVEDPSPARDFLASLSDKHPKLLVTVNRDSQDTLTMFKMV